MEKSRFTPEQIIGFIKQVDAGNRTRMTTSQRDAVYTREMPATTGNPSCDVPCPLQLENLTSRFDWSKYK